MSEQHITSQVLVDIFSGLNAVEAGAHRVKVLFSRPYVDWHDSPHGETYTLRYPNELTQRIRQLDDAYTRCRRLLDLFTEQDGRP